MTDGAGSDGRVKLKAGWRVYRADRNIRSPALGLLLTGQPTGHDPAVENFLGFASGQNLSVHELWVAESDGQPLSVALIVPSAGRTGMMFVSPVRRPSDREVLSDVAGAACRAQGGRKMRLIQVLLEPSQQMERQALAVAGFTDLAQLLYMRCPARGTGNSMVLDRSIELVHWSRRHRGTFAQAAAASYTDTLDCPGLLGLRDIDDILDGHMATGVFIADLWFALRCEGQPIGVMLLNLVPQRRALELVYLGLSPAWRGRGLGRQLVRHGLWLAPRHQANEVILAVDRINTPGISLYRSVGFTQTARKLAMIFTSR